MEFFYIAIFFLLRLSNLFAQSAIFKLSPILGWDNIRQKNSIISNGVFGGR
jgi:hypothetical protein